MVVMKINRVAVYGKYNGHCAYCGREITQKQMQVDHIIPHYRTGNNDLENLHPACAHCNHYKGGFELEQFRTHLMQLDLRLSEVHKIRVAMGFGIVAIRPWDGVFFFERSIGLTNG